jgi:hypothetical protein
MFAIMHFSLAVAAFSKFAAKRTRHTNPVLRNRVDDAASTDILTHTLFLVNQTGAVKDEWYVRMARNAKTTENGLVLYCGTVSYDCSRRARLD